MLNKITIKEDCVEIEVRERDRKEICIVDLSDFYKKIKPTNKTLFLFKDKNYIYFVVNKKKIRLHRFLTACPRNLDVDHKDRNPLNNRQSNLRCVDKVINGQNRLFSKDSKTKIRGVDFHVKRNKYRGLVQVDKKRFFLGWFDNKEDCARVVADFRQEKLKAYNKKQSVI